MSYQGKTREELDIWSEEMNYQAKKAILIMNDALPSQQKRSPKEKLEAVKNYIEEEIKSVERNFLLNKDVERVTAEFLDKKNTLLDVKWYINSL